MRITAMLRWAVLLLLAGCTQPVAIREETSPPPLPEASYAAAARSGAAVYRLLPQESLILVHVGRAGAMQRLGHEHAVASEDVRGFVEWHADASAARADIAFAVRDLIVDKPQYRERLELDTTPSADDVAGTYANMLRVLEPDTYPWVTAQARIAETGAGKPTLAVSVTLHGTTFEYLVPVDLAVDERRIAVTGHATIRHSDFGLSPFSAAGGLLRVADELDIDFHLVGRVAHDL